MKVLVVSYSHTGTCRRVRQALCRQPRWVEAEVVELRAGRSNWRCMLDSLLRRSPAIQYKGPAPEEFDIVVLIAPIWVNQLAGPMRSFVRSYRDSLPDAVAFVSVMGSSGGLNALAEVTRLLGRSPAVFDTLTSGEVASPGFDQRVNELRVSVLNAKSAPTPPSLKQTDDVVLN